MFIRGGDTIAVYISNFSGVFGAPFVVRDFNMEITIRNFRRRWFESKLFESKHSLCMYSAIWAEWIGTMFQQWNLEHKTQQGFIAIPLTNIREFSKSVN